MSAMSKGRGRENGWCANFKTKHTDPLPQEIPSALYCTQEGRKGRSANLKTKHTEPLTQEILSALYCTPEWRGEEKGGTANFKTKHTQNLWPKQCIQPCTTLPKMCNWASHNNRGPLNGKLRPAHHLHKQINSAQAFRNGRLPWNCPTDPY